MNTFMNITEASEYIGVDCYKFRKLIEHNIITGHKICEGAVSVFIKQDLDDLKELFKVVEPNADFVVPLEETRVCTKCKQEKPLSEFSKHRSTKDGLRYMCKDCANKAFREYCKQKIALAKFNNSVNNNIKPINPNLYEAKTRFCPKCNQFKNLTEFNKNKSCKDGLQGYCRDCQATLNGSLKSHPLNTKTIICKTCKRELTAENFPLTKNRKGYINKCRDCCSETMRRIMKEKREARISNKTSNFQQYSEQEIKQLSESCWKILERLESISQQVAR